MKRILLLTGIALLTLSRAANAQVIYPDDNGFQSPSLSPGTIEVAPTGTPWTFSTSYSDSTTAPNEAGIATTGSQNIAGSPGGQSAFLQNVSSISQSITLSADASVSVTFDWEGRSPVSYTNQNNQNVTTQQDEITVTLGGILLFQGTPTTTTSFVTVTTASSEFAGGTYQLVFSGITSGASTNTFTDSMTFIDNVQVNTDAAPEPSTCGLFALGGVALAALLRKRKNSKG